MSDEERSDNELNSGKVDRKEDEQHEGDKDEDLNSEGDEDLLKLSDDENERREKYSDEEEEVCWKSLNSKKEKQPK